MGLNLDLWALTINGFGIKIIKCWTMGQRSKQGQPRLAKVRGTVFLDHAPIFLSFGHGFGDSKWLWVKR